MPEAQEMLLGAQKLRLFASLSCLVGTLKPL